MKTYAKVMPELFNGEMYGAGPVVLMTWIYLLTHRYSTDGVAEFNNELCASAIGAPVEEVEAAVQKLIDMDRIEEAGAFMYEVKIPFRETPRSGSTASIMQQKIDSLEIESRRARKKRGVR